jgi:hypothetical protein
LRPNAWDQLVLMPVREINTVESVLRPVRRIYFNGWENEFNG